MKKIVFCNICGECLGEYKPFFAKKHIKENPTHIGFLIKTIIDPLLLKDPDYWFKKKDIVPNQPRGNTWNNSREDNSTIFLRINT